MIAAIAQIDAVMASVPESFAAGCASLGPRTSRSSGTRLAPRGDMPPRSRSLWPREHGAYVQLAVPLATALAISGGSVAGAALAVSAMLAFVASESLRIVSGAHGLRVREHDGPRAWRRLLALGVPALVLGGAGLAAAPRAAAGLAAASMVPLVLVVRATIRRTEGTIVAECAAAVGLSGAAAPVAVAGGMSTEAAIVMWSGWSIAYAMTVLAVHHVLAPHRRVQPSSTVRWLAASAAVVALGALLAVAPSVAFVLPVALTALAVFVRRPRATRLRALGVAFTVMSVASAAVAGWG